MEELLTSKELPIGFAYPEEFLRVVRLGLTALEPWEILTGDPLRARRRGMAERYPERSFIPFARRENNDDVACFDLQQGDGRIAIVHDYAAPGWERREDYVDFHAWLRQVFADFIEWA